MSGGGESEILCGGLYDVQEIIFIGCKTNKKAEKYTKDSVEKVFGIRWKRIVDKRTEEKLKIMKKIKA